MGFKHDIRKFLWKTGIDLGRFEPATNHIARMRELFKLYTIDLVLDVGANSGQFGETIRRDFDYTGTIVSFEPLKAAFAELEKNSRSDSKWTAMNIALGDTNERRQINISNNSLSSSILEMLPAHADAAPSSTYVGRENIEVRTLDSIYSDICGDSASILLKIDTQGFEREVIDGARNSMGKIDTVQLEMSLVPLYEGGILFEDLFALMKGYGYGLVSVEEVFSDPATGQLLQIDGLFHRF